MEDNPKDMSNAVLVFNYENVCRDLATLEIGQSQLQERYEAVKADLVKLKAELFRRLMS